jgi:hypothetical protein
MKTKLNLIAAAVVLASSSLIGVAHAGSTATANVQGTVVNGCDFPASSFTITFPEMTTTSLSATGGLVTKIGAIQLSCSSGVTAQLNLGSGISQELDLDGDGSNDVGVSLAAGDTCSTGGNGGWPYTVTGNGAVQDIPVCAVVRNIGRPVPAGTINASWPLSYTVN